MPRPSILWVIILLILCLPWWPLQLLYNVTEWKFIEKAANWYGAKIERIML